MEIEMMPYYHKFNDNNNTIYDLKEVKGLHKVEYTLCNPIDGDLYGDQEYLIVISVGINHKEIKLYYGNKEIRDKDYDVLVEMFKTADMFVRGE